jgi:hypothetical protein
MPERGWARIALKIKGRAISFRGHFQEGLKHLHCENHILEKIQGVIYCTFPIHCDLAELNMVLFVRCNSDRSQRVMGSVGF